MNAAVVEPPAHKTRLERFKATSLEGVAQSVTKMRKMKELTSC